MSSYSHQLGVQDWVWEWLQSKSGLRNPASYGRKLLERIAIADIQGSPAMIEPVEVTTNTEPSTEERWERLGMGEYQEGVRDHYFMEARDAWVIGNCETEEAAVTWFENRVGEGSITKPCGWVISWYQKMKLREQ